MTDSVKSIRTGIETVIETITAFTKLDNKFSLEKNNFTNEVERYGVIAKTGAKSDTSVLRYLTIDREFEITLCNKFISQHNQDQRQEAVGDLLESNMETIIDELEGSKAGLPALVMAINFASNEAVDYDEIENLAILRFSVVATYRKQITNC